MRRSITLAGALAALALATTAGCSSTKGSANTNPTTTRGTAGTSTNAATSPPASVAASSTANLAGSASVEVCSLLTAGQATTLNKVTYGSATPANPSNGYNTCTYKNTGSADPVDIQDLTVTVVTIPGCWSALQSADGPGKAIPGVGDAAFGAQIGIDIQVGSRCVTIDGLTRAELLGNYAPDIAMAKIILTKLS